MHGIRRTTPISTGENLGSGLDPFRERSTGPLNRRDKGMTPLDGLLQRGKIVGEVHDG
jgi:hypothetical protein